ncbi:GIY-YIG nuclease family protein [Rhodanobacter sp. 7MK24]|uniref:GIY-YIG nuclease family protein n=1 Tax=Rhodanobacter sp. 7MK24 TaxID=2775922 RepID=UPI001782B6A2|nr:GIY-YIG nuclease family protein [Rhodanobacter sp. 7MK24]
MLPLAYEDILKVGISHDPFARALAFSHRYYEFFDLSRSVLVEFDSRKQAQARETALHRRLREWNAMQPITVPRAAAGKREWYRGAYEMVLAQVETDEREGRTVHRPARSWWQARLCAEREKLYEWTIQLMRDEASPLSLHERRQRLADVLDAYAQLGVPLEGVLPRECHEYGR